MSAVTSALVAITPELMRYGLALLSQSIEEQRKAEMALLRKAKRKSLKAANEQLGKKR